MLGPTPISKPKEQPKTQGKVQDLVRQIKQDFNDNELLKHFQVLTASVSKKKGPILDPSYSSSPTGGKWTLDALSQNIKAALHIDAAHTGALKDMLSLPLKEQVTLLSAIVERLLGKKAPVNDRNNTFETVMGILGNLGPEYNDLIYVVSQPLLDSFYADIPKPFNNYVGYPFRSADGSDNSLLYPTVGKAGNNYVRSVQASKRDNNENLPSAKEVFDKVLKRPEGVFNEHESGINMLLFYMAILITHDLFYTDSKDPMRNLTTSYVDLSVLYGFNRDDQISIRQMEHGLIKPDQWFDKRLVIQPPGVAGLLVVFSRNHNYIAKKLLEINENQRFSYGPGQRLKSKEEQDEVLFQTARLVNNGCFANVVVHDYVRTIVGTHADSNLTLDPLAEPGNSYYGNAVSIEFNMVYRWHPAIGKQDSEWMDQVMKLLTAQVTPDDNKAPGQERALINKGTQSSSTFDKLLEAFNEHFVHASPEELTRGLPIAGMHRQQDGQFQDTDIVNALKRGYLQKASEIGNGLNTPASLEHVEIAGINQGRILNVCTFNEFRAFLNLTTMKTFEDFSEKVEVQKALKELYGTPDNVELYTGLMVERTKQTGLRLPYTMGRAILSDAVNLLRNDRILTKELVPANLTNWGYKYMLGDPKQSNRILPSLLSHLLQPESGGFTTEELRTLFNVPNP